MKQENKPINLLWTGGWDSTFRLLQCLVLLKKKVQPYYLIDVNRKSLPNELQAISTIKNIVYKSYPNIKNLLLPTIFDELSSIPENKEISNAYSEVIKTINLGEQYEWLARYCNYKKIDNMELSFEKDVENLKYNLVRKNLKRIDKDFGESFIYDESLNNEPFHSLFSYFEWPIAEINRQEMIKISKENGFDNLLFLTWFCHTPKRNTKPCGTCTPCIQVMESKLSYRLPINAKMRYCFRGIISRQHFKKKYPGLYHFIKTFSRS